MYRRLYRWGRPLAGERTKAETAYEFMGKLIARIDTITGHSRFANDLFRTKRDVKHLTDLYQDTLFAHHILVRDDVSSALDTWKRLRSRLFFARLYVVAKTASSRRSSGIIMSGASLPGRWAGRAQSKEPDEAIS
jgi:hypothetical protein